MIPDEASHNRVVTRRATQLLSIVSAVSKTANSPHKETQIRELSLAAGLAECIVRSLQVSILSNDAKDIGVHTTDTALLQSIEALRR
jgi:hypothetical protein